MTFLKGYLEIKKLCNKLAVKALNVSLQKDNKLQHAQVMYAKNKNNMQWTLPEGTLFIG